MNTKDVNHRDLDNQIGGENDALAFSMRGSDVDVFFGMRSR
jgi:hypothetical protein